MTTYTEQKVEVLREIAAVDKERKALKEKAKALHAKLDELIALEIAERTASSLDPASKQKLLQVLQAEGIESEESFGVVGAK